MPNPTPIDGKGPVSLRKRMEHWLKAAVFSGLRLLLRKGRVNAPLLNGNEMKRVLFLRPETKLGDMVISLPVIDRFREHFPGVEVHIFASPRNVGIIKADPRFDRVYLYRKRLGEIVRELKKVRKTRYDCVLDLLCDDSVTALLMSQWAAPGAWRVGVGKQRYARFYDFNYFTSLDESRHIISNTMRLLEAFGIDSAEQSGYAPPHLPESFRTRAEEQMSKLYPEGRPEWITGLNLSAGALSRYWGEKKHKELLARIWETHPETEVLVFTTPAERSLGESLVEHFGRRIRLVPDALCIQGATALIRYLNVLVTPDTSLVHIARSFKIPVVAMYPGFRKNLVLWHPFEEIDGAVLSHNIGDIFDITVDQVVEAYETVVKRHGTVRTS